MSKLDDAEWWRKQLQEPICNQRFVDDSRPTNNTKRFFTENQLEDNNMIADEDRPTDTRIYEYWKQLMLPLASVDIQSSKNCTVVLPFVNSLKKLAQHENEDDPEDFFAVTWLARALAEAAVKIFIDGKYEL